MQLSFPGDVDIASNSVKTILKEFQTVSPQPQFDFTDGQNAGWSYTQYMGRILVSNPLNPEEKTKLASAAETAVQIASKWAKKNHYVFEELSVKPHEGMASHSDGHFSVSLFLGNNFVRLSSSAPNSTWAERKTSFQMFVSGIASRPFGTVPHIPGVCLPYIFIGDDETPGRSISATYRLKDHPDITIWLEDSNAARIGPGQNPEKFTPVSQSDFFWTQRYGSGVRKSVRSIWAIPYRNIDFAGQKGVESFVRIIRGDDAEDFGYLAVVRGDPDAKKDTPDLMLYVIRDAKNSTAKGIEPVSKDAFLEIAQTIAASVKRRPTK